MCFFGGKPKVDNSAQIYYQQQAAKERERQANIEQSIGTINSIFNEGGREPIYGQVYDAAYGNYMEGIQDQYEDAVGNLRIQLARSGLGGSSTDAYKNADLQELYDKAVLDAERRADNIRRNFMAQDQQTRASLISQAYGGLPATAAADIGRSALSANESNFLRNARAESLGDLFSGVTSSVAGGIRNAGVPVGRRQYDDEFSNYFNTGNSYTPVYT